MQPEGPWVSDYDLNGDINLSEKNPTIRQRINLSYDALKVDVFKKEIHLII